MLNHKSRLIFSGIRSIASHVWTHNNNNNYVHVHVSEWASFERSMSYCRWNAWWYALCKLTTLIMDDLRTFLMCKCKPDCC